MTSSVTAQICVRFVLTFWDVAVSANRVSEAAPGGSTSRLPPTVEGTVVTVGTFDGVHLGHRAILEEIERRARAAGLHSVLLTFDRHPLTVLRPDEAVAGAGHVPHLTHPAQHVAIVRSFIESTLPVS